MAQVVQQTILYENRVELALGEELGRERTVIRIDVDLPRTFPMLGLFGTTGPFHLRLKAVLQAFAMLRPDLGYVQGMSLIAAMLCLHVDAIDDVVSADEGGAAEAGAEGGGGGGGGGARPLQSGLQRGMRKTKRAKAKRGAKVMTNTVPGHSGGMSRSLSSERLNEIRVGMSRSTSFDRLAAPHGSGGTAAGRPRAHSSGGGGSGRVGPVPPEADITSLALDSTAFVTYSCLTNMIVGYEHLFAFFSQDVEMIQACVFLLLFLFLSFPSLCNPFTRSPLPSPPPPSHRYISIFDAVLLKLDPGLAKWFASNEPQIESLMYLVTWLQTVFLKCLPLRVAAIVWDNFLLPSNASGGTGYLYRVAIAILKFVAPQLRSLPFEGAMRVLTKPIVLSGQADEKRLFRMIDAVVLPAGTLEQLNELHRA